jgi:hypothetical protein
MKEIKLSGREMAVLRAIDYTTGSTGDELRARTNLEPADLADILNGMMAVGFVEAFPHAEPLPENAVAATRFEINPSYALQLREALKRR